MKRVDELWEILCDAVSEFVPLKGRYCTPITGGLDSRVLAGIMKDLGREIELSYWIRTPANEYNEEHIHHLRDLINPAYYCTIDVEELPRDFPIAIDKLENLTSIRKYSFLMALHMDIFTGMSKTKRKDREYFYKTWPKMHVNDYREFKEIILPFENTRVLGYLMSLSRRDRFFQGLYMDMIRKYLPDLAQVPRCFEKGTGRPVPINGDRMSYTLWRVIDRLI